MINQPCPTCQEAGVYLGKIAVLQEEGNWLDYHRWWCMICRLTFSTRDHPVPQNN